MDLPAVNSGDVRALVLLSGGLDSTVALYLASQSRRDVRAVSFWYGQPQAAEELSAAQKLAEECKIPWSSLHLAEAVRGLRTIGPPPPGIDSAGISRANLPGRNLIFLTVAAAHAARIWSGGEVVLVIGVNTDDANVFPDCGAEFLHAAGVALSSAFAGILTFRVWAPFIEQKIDKIGIVRYAAQHDPLLGHVRRSVSCYRGARCGICDACTLRARAFLEAGVDDGAEVPAFIGGDPGRSFR